MPTLSEIAGAEYPETFKGNEILPTEGKSLVPLFLNASAKIEHETLFWEHEGNRAVRKGDWKLVSRFDYEKRTELPWELYNLKTDRSETENLIHDNTELAAELEKLYKDWAKRVQVVPYIELQEMRRQKRN
jgi:arylsulfatase